MTCVQFQSQKELWKILSLSHQKIISAPSSNQAVLPQARECKTLRTQPESWMEPRHETGQDIHPALALPCFVALKVRFGIPEMLFARWVTLWSSSWGKRNWGREGSVLPLLEIPKIPRHLSLEGILPQKKKKKKVLGSVFESETKSAAAGARVTPAAVFVQACKNPLKANCWEAAVFFIFPLDFQWGSAVLRSGFAASVVLGGTDPRLAHPRPRPAVGLGICRIQDSPVH